MFGRRALNRADDGGMLFSRIELIIGSLVESGDVEIVGDAGPHTRAIRPRGKALTTIAQGATDERRHRDTSRLTWVLIFIGTLQVIAALMQIQSVRDFAQGLVLPALVMPVSPR
jgi:hypothetical protein